MNLFTKIYRFSWLIFLILLFFLDRNNPYWVFTTILLLIMLSGIAILRSLESRKEWRKYLEDKTFTVRKISGGIGVERIFPFHSPNIESIKVLKEGKVRRAKLYYLRSRKGKATRIREKTQ